MFYVVLSLSHFFLYQWKGYNPEEFKEVIEKHNRIELETRKLKHELREQKKAADELQKAKNKLEEKANKKKDRCGC